MLVEVYYFVKYFRLEFFSYFTKISNCDAIFTFDLEASIQDISSKHASLLLKAKHRKILQYILNNKELDKSKKYAIRINELNSDDFFLDIDFLKNIKNITLHTILIPKIKSKEEVLYVHDLLTKKKIQYKGLAVFIETKQGFDNLQSIISLKLNGFEKIIFGHADYNFDNNFFPFFHQNTYEYWSWVQQIVQIAEKYNFTFINSPCFYLKDYLLFNKMLSKLSHLCKNNYGQLTLSYKQSLLCNQFLPNQTSDNCIEEPINKNLFEYSAYIINVMEHQIQKKGFTIDNNGCLITPQEYLLAKDYIKNNIEEWRN